MKFYIKVLLAACMSVFLLFAVGCGHDDPDVSEGIDYDSLPTLQDCTEMNAAEVTNLFAGVERSMLHLLWGDPDTVSGDMDVYYTGDATGLFVTYTQSGAVEEIKSGPVERIADVMDEPTEYQPYNHQPDVAPQATPVPTQDIDESVDQFINGLLGETPAPDESADEPVDDTGDTQETSDVPSDVTVSDDGLTFQPNSPVSGQQDENQGDSEFDENGLAWNVQIED